MIALPEALTVAGQLNATINGKRINSVTTAHTPHKLVWYYGEPSSYNDILTGKAIGQAEACGSMIEIKAGNACILLGESAATIKKRAYMGGSIYYCDKCQKL